MKKKYNMHHVGEEYPLYLDNTIKIKIVDGGSRPVYNTVNINGYITEARYDSIVIGKVKYPYYPTIFNIGYDGVGKYKITNYGNKETAYNLWYTMLKTIHNNLYKFEISEEWRNYQKFAEWFDKNKDMYFKLKKLGIVSLDCFLYGKVDKDKYLFSADTTIFLPTSIKKQMINKKCFKFNNFYFYFTKYANILDPKTIEDIKNYCNNK